MTLGGYAPKCEEYSNNDMTFRWLTDQQDLSIELKFLQTFFYPLIIVVVDVKIFIANHIKNVYNYYVSVAKDVYKNDIHYVCLSINLVSRELLSLQGFFLSEKLSLAFLLLTVCN